MIVALINMIKNLIGIIVVLMHHYYTNQLLPSLRSREGQG